MVIVSAANGKPGLQSRVPLLTIGLAVLLVSVFAVLAVDAPLARLMKVWVGGEAAVLFRFLSGFGVGTGYIVIACGGLLFGALARRFDLSPFGNAELLRIQRYCLLTLLSLAASGAAVNLAKLPLGRHRPRDLFAKGQFGFESFGFHHGLDSFPSGHSQTIFVIATVLALAAPKRVRMLMGAAALVAASRVVMTNHYLSDVLVGSYIGAAAVLTIAPSILVDKASLLPPGIMSRASGFFRFQTT